MRKEPESTYKGLCPRCQKDIEYKFPVSEFVNGETTSAVILLHAENKCPHCNLKFGTRVYGAQGLKFSFHPIAEVETTLGGNIEQDKAPLIVTANNIPQGLVPPRSKRD